MYNQILKQLINGEIEVCSLTLVDQAGNTKGAIGKKLLIGQGKVYYVADELKQLLPEQGEALAKLGQLAHLSIAHRLVMDGAIQLGDDHLGRFLVEPVLPEAKLLIFGAGHIARPLAQLADLQGIPTIVYDDRPDLANGTFFPQAARIICDGFDRLDQYRLIGPRDLVVVATRGHKQDLTCLRHVLKHRYSYIGMVSSRRRAIEVQELLGEEGYTKEQIASVHAPIGLPIGAVTPAQIAISIMAEIIDQSKPVKISELPLPALSQGEHLKAGSHDPQAIHVFKQMTGGLQGQLALELAVATVIATSGSTPRKAGAKMLIGRDGETFGTIGGGCAEAQVKLAAIEALRVQQPTLLSVAMNNQVAADEGMMCGGCMEVFIELLGANGHE